MNTNEHTPGPWLISTIQGEDALMVGGDDGSLVVADIRTDHKGGVPEANAALVAASPDLLAVCEAVLASIHDPDFDDYFDGARIEVMLKKAIAKARGEA